MRQKYTDQGRDAVAVTTNVLHVCLTITTEPTGKKLLQ